MKTRMSPYRPGSATVTVAFTHPGPSGEVKHVREVLVVFGEDGAFDRDATRDRIAEVALGVASKIEAGLLVE